ncbi:hypothetical protein HGRIS_005791 [Hohenbuehelia grisea]|uniref:Uncharacterized protein n=1 Tax=Hohenbuehelia grisea TaxID=104357 RepID=A0ABR3JXV8_9AGAR
MWAPNCPPSHPAPSTLSSRAPLPSAFSFLPFSHPSTDKPIQWRRCIPNRRTALVARTITIWIAPTAPRRSTKPRLGSTISDGIMCRKSTENSNAPTTLVNASPLRGLISSDTIAYTTTSAEHPAPNVSILALILRRSRVTDRRVMNTSPYLASQDD